VRVKSLPDARAARRRPEPAAGRTMRIAEQSLAGQLTAAQSARDRLDHAQNPREPGASVGQRVPRAGPQLWECIPPAPQGAF